MKKTLAQLKKDAKAGKLVCEIIEHYGKTGNDIPERLRGKRPVIGANTVGIIFRNADGKKSDLRIERASLVDYEDETLTLYAVGDRLPTPAEQSVLDEWKKIEETEEFQEQAKTDALTDGSSTYWKKKWFFKDKGFPWMAGFCDLNEYNKSYNPSTGMVADRNVRGNAIIRYRVYQN